MVVRFEELRLRFPVGLARHQPGLLVHITQPAQHCGHATLRVRHPKGFLHPVGDRFGREVQVRLKMGVQFHQVLGLAQANAATVTNTPQAHFVP